jgi:hypothetical protein
VRVGRARAGDLGWLTLAQPDRRDLDALIAGSLAARDAGSEVRFAIVERSSRRAIGSTRDDRVGQGPQHRAWETVPAPTEPEIWGRCSTDDTRKGAPLRSRPTTS